MPTLESRPESPSVRTIPLFFVLALGITWVLQTPALLAQRGFIDGPIERYLLPAALGGFGPVLAAVLAARHESGAGGVRALFRRLFTRVGALWYLAALGLCPAIHLAGVAVYGLFGGRTTGLWFFPPENGQQVFAMFLIPLAEEPGWRGFALPRLEERYRPLAASLILGVVWALWHTIMFLVAGVLTASLFAMSMLNIVLGSVVFSWLYHRTRGSLLIAVFAHMGAHLNNPSHALPDNVTPFAIYNAAIFVAAALLIFLDRAVWKTEPRRP